MGIPSYSGFIGMLDVMLPNGGVCVPISIECYFDESESRGANPVLCVAGYAFRKNRVRQMSREWRKLLVRYGLSAFHMVDCAHGNKEFKSISKDDRIIIQTKFISLVNEYAEYGFAVTMVEDEFSSTIGRHPLSAKQYPSAYTFCVHIVLTGVLNWLAKQKNIGDVAYYFEAGHSSQGRAGLVMHDIFFNSRLKQGYHYGGHGFIEKKKSPAVQAADILAWQWAKDRKNQAEGRPRRKDCVALLRSPTHETAHCGSQWLKGAVDEVNYLHSLPRALAEIYDQMSFEKLGHSHRRPDPERSQ